MDVFVSEPKRRPLEASSAVELKYEPFWGMLPNWARRIRAEVCVRVLQTGKALVPLVTLYVALSSQDCKVVVSSGMIVANSVVSLLTRSSTTRCPRR